VYGVGSVGREAVGDVWRVDVRTYVLSYAAEDVCNHSVEEPAVCTRIRQDTSGYVRIRQHTSALKNLGNAHTGVYDTHELHLDLYKIGAYTETSPTTSREKCRICPHITISTYLYIHIFIHLYIDVQEPEKG
jgi:hypothetical protein